MPKAMGGLDLKQAFGTWWPSFGFQENFWCNKALVFICHCSLILVTKYIS